MQTLVTTKDAERILGIKKQTLKRKYAKHLIKKILINQCSTERQR